MSSTQSPLQTTLTIFGLGLMGGSLARDFRALGSFGRIVGVDSSPSHCERALQLGLVDEILEPEQAAQMSDFVVLCVPVDSTEVILPSVLENLTEGAVVTDIGSAKANLARLIEGHPKRSRFVLAHPMAGTENSGPDAAIRGLYRDKTVVICDRSSSDPDAVRQVEDLYGSLGMKVIYMASEEHDQHVAYISHLSHIISFVLANTVLDREKDVQTIFDLASGGFESTARLGKSSPQMWEPIFRTNKEPILRALRAYERHLADFRDTISDGDQTRLLRLMREANEIRPVLAKIFSNENEPHSEPTLDSLRSEIDDLDEQLLKNLSLRFDVVRRIGELKQREGVSASQPERWTSLLLEREKTGRALGLNKKFVSELMEQIHAESLSLQTLAATTPKTRK